MFTPSCARKITAWLVAPEADVENRTAAAAPIIHRGDISLSFNSQCWQHYSQSSRTSAVLAHLQRPLGVNPVGSAMSGLLLSVQARIFQMTQFASSPFRIIPAAWRRPPCGLFAV